MTNRTKELADMGVKDPYEQRRWETDIKTAKNLKDTIEKWEARKIKYSNMSPELRVSVQNLIDRSFKEFEEIKLRWPGKEI